MSALAKAAENGAVVQVDGAGWLAIVRALWDVRVLDAWGQSQSGVPSPRKLINGNWGCLDFVGPNPEAARAAAAQAAFPTLSPEARAKLGERP